jgi:hypothetical protein
MYSAYINSNRYNSSRLACAVQSITFNRDSKIPLRLDYFQGPRTHIALVLLWRPVASDDPDQFTDPACGLYGNNYFFDSTQVPSVPQDPWIELLSRGWKVLGPANYLLPEQFASNPCDAI